MIKFSNWIQNRQIAEQNKDNIIHLNVKKPWEIGKGHNAHRSGSGEHQDKRNKRNNTRSSKLRKSLRDQEF